MFKSIGPSGLLLSVALVPLVLASSPVDAQRPDFLFHEPNGTIALYGGWWMPREGSDLFDFVRKELTIDRGDFNAPMVGAEASWRLMRNLDLVGGIEHARAEQGSELRDWVEDGLPIRQTTEFSSTRATAGARLYLLERGQAIGSHAWIPARWSPFVGGGGGVAWYRFEQYGDFIDYRTVDDPAGPEIFTDRFQSRGNGMTGHAMAGLDVSVARNIVLRGEYRYHWGSAAVSSRDFDGFGPIDLAGHRMTVGIATRF
jgi:opacity protein-like surface antigen